MKAKIILSTILLLNTYSAQIVNWERTHGPFGGYMNDVAVGSNGNIYASAQYTIYKSINSGANWTELNLKTESNILNISTSCKGKLFVVDSWSKVYQSDDYGIQWNRTFHLPGGAANISLNDKEKIFCYNSKTLYSSSDHGITWVNTLKIDSSYITDFYVSSDSICFLTSQRSIYYSSNEGLTWEKVTNNFTLAGINSIRAASDGKIFVNSVNGVYCSSDFGKNWELFLPRTGSLEIDKSDNLWVYNRYAIYKIKTDGTEFTETCKIERPFSYELVFTDDGLIFIASPEGIYISQDDGFTWFLSNEGITALNTTRPVITKHGSLYFYTQFKIFRTSDNGNSWEGIKLPPNSSEIINYAVDEDETIYAGDHKGICITTDFGKSWTRKSLSEYAWGMTVDKNKFYAVTSKELFTTSDKGQTWESFLLGDDVCCPGRILISKRGTIFIARPGHVLKSDDGGKTWIKVTSADMGDMIISRLGSILFTSPKGVFKSTDEGATWIVKQIVADVNPSEISTLKNGKIYVTMGNGDIYFSDDDGESWQLFDKYENLKFTAIGLITDSEGYLFSGSFQQGVYRSASPFLKILPPDPGIKPGNQKVFISWNKNSSPDFLKYHIYGSQDPYPTTLIAIVLGANDTSITIDGLTNTIPYHIVVSAVDNLGNESYSEELIATPVPPPLAPSLVSVENESIDVSTDLLLKWNKSLYADSYHFQLSTDSLFGSVTFDDSTLTDTVKQVIGLNNVTKYFWRVRATGISGVSDWSGTWSFSTVIATPGQPLLVNPVNNSTNQAISQNFRWLKAIRAEKYHIQISKEQNFAGLILNNSTLTDTLIVVLLENGTKFYWRVRALNAGGPSEWSEVRNFTTIVALPDIPTLASPANNSTDVGIQLIVHWKKAKNAESYSIQVSSDSLFTEVTDADSTLLSEMQIRGLFSGIKYYWRVRSKNAAGVSGYSPVWNFTTILYPPEGLKAQNVGVHTVKLSWTDKTYSESGFILERKHGNEGFIHIDSLKANTFLYIDSSVIGGQNYTYRIKAFTEYANSVYSNEAVITPLTLVNYNTEMPKDYSLLQNYPNPFNPGTLIKYSVPVESHVNISIYNSLGEIIKELSKEIKQPGYYEVSFDASGLSSGIYLYALKATSTDGMKNFISVKKMILMK